MFGLVDDVPAISTASISLRYTNIRRMIDGVCKKIADLIGKQLYIWVNL